MALKPMTLGQASKFTSPNPLTLVCTQTPERKTNLAAVSWWTYLSFNPNLIGFAMNKASYSGEMVRQNQKVALAMPGKDLAQAALSCGSVSGRDADKAEKFGIDLTSLPDCPIQVPVHRRVVIQCYLQQTVEAGDHDLDLWTRFTATLPSKPSSLGTATLSWPAPFKSNKTRQESGLWPAFLLHF